MQYNTTNKMIHTVTEYAKLRGVHRNTIIAWIKRETLPSNHIVKKGKQYMIEIIHGSENCARCDLYEKASIEYNKRKPGDKPDHELAAEICVKYDLGARKFFAMHGII